MFLALGMPGPFEWIIILVMLLGGWLVLRALVRAGRPPERRGFDVEPPRDNRDERR
jgi:hypothetical protein